MKLVNVVAGSFACVVATLAAACAAPVSGVPESNSTGENTDNQLITIRTEEQQRTCESCVQASCRDSYEACTKEAGCFDLAVCTLNAKDDKAVSDCKDAHPEFVAMFNALESCNAEICSTQCNGKPHGGTGGPGPVKSYP